MRSLPAPDSLSSADRLDEIAAILAAGILRLHGQLAHSVENGSGILQESAEEALEVPDETVLTVTPGSFVPVPDPTGVSS